MFFNELNEENFLLFAIKNYNNPQGLTEDDFYKDLNHFKYIKRHLKKYVASGELKIHLLLKHFIILYNIFGDATTPMLFFKVPKELWSSMKTFIIFLNRLPDYPKCYIHDIDIDQYCMEKLEEL
jgi:hypothetical protein